MPVLRFSQRKIKQSFLRIAGVDELIDLSDWQRALKIESDFLMKRLFNVVDLDNSGYIDFLEFKTFVQSLNSDDPAQRYSKVFECCDTDGDGKISANDLTLLISNALLEQKLTLTKEKINSLVEDVLETSTQQKRSLNSAEFTALLASKPAYGQQLEHFLVELIGQTKRRKRARFTVGLGRRLWLRFKQVCMPYSWLLAYIVGNVWLFDRAMNLYHESGASVAVQVARGAGACLNLSAALLLLPMCKGLLSVIRHSPLYFLVPVDRTTEIHKGLAFATIGFTVLHISAHGFNYLATEQIIANVLLTTVVGVTGLLLTAILLVMWLTYRSRHRRYERFTVSHWLYAPFFIVLIGHAANFWMWLVPGALMYVIDGLFRAIFRYKKVAITELNSLSDRTTQVKFKRGKHISFRPGDYIRVRIPELSRLQWHPFTLSAAPNSDRMDIHVRNNGNWSGALNNLSRQQHPLRKQWVAYIDGPYAAPSSSIYRSNIAVMIAGGIGVTPFASVLQSLISAKNQGKTIIHFHWLSRTQESYEWFQALIAKAEQQLGSDNFKVHIHLTSLNTNLATLPLQFAFDAHWQKQGTDAITGLHARLSAGRPGWDSLFKELIEEHKNNPIDIYYCGPVQLSRELRRKAHDYGLSFHEEKFD